jgi:hypothetical protein
MNIIINASRGRGLAGIAHAPQQENSKILKKMGLKVSKQDGKIKKSKSYQGGLTENKRFITPSSPVIDTRRAFCAECRFAPRVNCPRAAFC